MLSTTQEIILDNPGFEVSQVQDVLKSIKDLDMEKFMEDVLTIRVAAPHDPFEDRVIPVSVNQTMMPIPRGVPVKVKRKYVEVLARAKEVRYMQHTPNPNEPDKIQLHGRVINRYPFEVLEDPSKHGRAWLEALMNDPIG